MKNIYSHSIFLCLTFCHLGVFGQSISNDTLKLEYGKIYSQCVQTDVRPVFNLLDVDTNKLSQKDIDFKMKFENRFKYSKDRDLTNAYESALIDTLVTIYKTYWRSSLLNPDQAYDSILLVNLEAFFGSDLTSLNDTLSLESRLDSLDSDIEKIVSNEGYYVNLGKVGRLRDLLIWETQIDTTYTFSIHNEEISAKVIFMEDFISLGWSKYATINKSIGGWATDDALFCVTESYDIESDWFKIHYLAHEGKHFSDYKVFPNLSGYDLEYRAKLTELSMAQETLYPIIKQFIGMAKYDSDDQHPVACYFVIKALSKKVFNSDSVTDMTLWETIAIETINNAAYELLQENTIALQNEGSDVENFIRKQPR